MHVESKYQMYRKQHVQPSGTDLGEVSAPFVMSQRAVGLKCTFRYNSNELDAGGLTWLPCKLFKIPDADDEQQDVVGESLLDICGNQ